MRLVCRDRLTRLFDQQDSTFAASRGPSGGPWRFQTRQGAIHARQTAVREGYPQSSGDQLVLRVVSYQSPAFGRNPNESPLRNLGRAPRGRNVDGSYGFLLCSALYGGASRGSLAFANPRDSHRSLSERSTVAVRVGETINGIAVAWRRGTPSTGGLFSVPVCPEDTGRSCRCSMGQGSITSGGSRGLPGPERDRVRSSPDAATT